MTTQRFVFRFSQAYRLAALPFGVAPSRCEVCIDDGRIGVRFGWWRVETTRDNIVDVAITGPYSFVKTAGPAHLSFADRGLTFASNGERGVCMEFRRPVPGIDPTGLIRHPNLTVTVADCDGLAAALKV
ncbi:hypothetical protein [Mycobacterium deserti]|uniref:Uncharacterized protein n=1 Tax=Mycobacterium deserti TaxID=2978347 RepID=A0ABT2MFU2_9MYCO|nr:hypothetical protein [Mycobacterium deserti]MCT7661142.1 hypothetical protein [Mycobacterium deserti]